MFTLNVYSSVFGSYSRVNWHRLVAKKLLRVEVKSAATSTYLNILNKSCFNWISKHSLLVLDSYKAFLWFIGFKNSFSSIHLFEAISRFFHLKKWWYFYAKQQKIKEKKLHSGLDVSPAFASLCMIVKIPPPHPAPNMHWGTKKRVLNHEIYMSMALQHIYYGYKEHTDQHMKTTTFHLNWQF